MEPLDHYEAYRLPFNASPPSATSDQKTIGGPPLRLHAGLPATRSFTDYPRVHLLTTQEFFVSGMEAPGARWTHVPSADPTYLQNTGVMGVNEDMVDYSTNVHYPNFGGIFNRIVRVGGLRRTMNPPSFYISNLAETCSATNSTPPNHQWAPAGLPAMAHNRFQGNVVILPGGQLFAIGGVESVTQWDQNMVPVVYQPCVEPELLLNSNQWLPMAQHTGQPRHYHSCALLLPDGRVFVGGGEPFQGGSRPGDYQIFNPPYLTMGLPRPTAVSITTLGGAPVSQTGFQGITYGVDYFAQWTNALPAGVVVEKVVLIRPAAVTHHDDGGQRYVELTSWPIYPDDTSGSYNVRRFTVPSNQHQAPPGWYMLFLVTNQLAPSVAYWVHLQ